MVGSQVPLLAQPCFLNSKLFLICPLSRFFKSPLSQEVKTPGFQLDPPLKHSAFLFITLVQSTNKTRWVQSQKHPDSDCFSVLTPLWPWLEYPPLKRRQLHLAPQFLPPWADNSPTWPVSQVLMASCMALYRPRCLSPLAQCPPSCHHLTVGVHP